MKENFPQSQFEKQFIQSCVLIIKIYGLRSYDNQ